MGVGVLVNVGVIVDVAVIVGVNVEAGVNVCVEVGFIIAIAVVGSNVLTVTSAAFRGVAQLASTIEIVEITIYIKINFFPCIIASYCICWLFV